MNGKFALLENNPTLRVGATSIAPYQYVIGLCFVLCLLSNLLSAPLPGNEDVPALYQRRTVHSTAHLVGRVVDVLEGFDASKLSQYGHLYRAFDMHAAAFIKPDGQLEFDIRILVPDTKRCQPLKSPLRNGSIISAHGFLLGYDSNAKGFCSLCRISITFPRIISLASPKQVPL